MRKAISIITILAIGAFVGNMINIGLNYAIHWQSLDPIDFMKSFKLDFPRLLAPTALTLMPAWLGSLWVFLKSPKKSESRKYRLYAFVGLTLVIAQTSIYHLPINLDFMALKYDAATATSQLNGWIVSHWIRVIVTIVSGVYAVMGFEKSTS